MYNYSTSEDSFLQHTFRQPENTNDAFYYAGNGSVYGYPQNPFNTTTAPMDSRRNMGMNGYVPNATVPFQNPTMNMGTPTEQPQNPVMPFSSYPSGTPNGCTPAFNAMAESRRNPAVAVNNAGNVNPWANQNQQMNPQIPTTPTFPQQTPNPFANPYANPYAYNAPVCPDYSTSALYNGGINGFDKKNDCWSNMYTDPRTIPQPHIDWNSCVNQQYPQPYQQYPQAPQYPKTDMTWVEMFNQNWANNR